MNDSVRFLPLKFVSGSEKLDQLDHDENQQRTIANVQNDGLIICTQPGFASDQRLCRSHSVEQMA